MRADKRSPVISLSPVFISFLSRSFPLFVFVFRWFVRGSISIIDLRKSCIVCLGHSMVLKALYGSTENSSCIWTTSTPKLFTSDTATDEISTIIYALIDITFSDHAFDFNVASNFCLR